MKKSKIPTPVFISEYAERIPLALEVEEVLLHPSLSHDALLRTLYWMWDAMDRALINFFVIGDTADSVMHNKDLYGDKITVGVRRLEWESGARNILDSFAPPISESEKGALYEYEGIPVELYIFDDDPTISSPNQVIYHSEYFKFPNPYDKFKEVFGWEK